MASTKRTIDKEGESEAMSKRYIAVTIRAALLQALVAGPGYGYGLAKDIGERTHGLLTVSEGKLYSALTDLEREGLVRRVASWPIRERGGRQREYYELTTRGLRQAISDREVVAEIFNLAYNGLAVGWRQ